MSSYSNFINDIYAVLSGDYADHFLAIDEVLEEVPASSDFVIRPSFNFGTSVSYTNLRDYEDDLIINLQIFKNHDSNTDIIEIGEDIKNKLKDLQSFVYEGWKFSIRSINLLKNFDTRYTGVTVQLISRKLEQVEEEPIDWSTRPLTFIAAEPNTKIIIRRYGTGVISTSIKYRFNIDDTWQSYTPGDDLTLSKAGDMVMFENTSSSSKFSYDANNYFNVECSGSFYARGQINSLTNYSSPGTYAFYKFFENNDAVLSTPLFPDGNGNTGVFQRMFYGCMNLKEAEDIKFTTATGASVCQEMFFNCINLKHAPKINIQSITGAGVFASMFYNCASLEDAPELPAPELPINSYRSMFQNCFKLKKAPELPATTIGQYVYYQMFQNCVSLEEPPTILPATQIEAYCYQSMFYNCKRITKAPQLNFTNAPNYSCQNMFYGCSALEEGPSALLPEVIEIGGFDYMFAGCEKLEKAPEIHAHSFAQYALRAAFQNCSKLIQAPTILSGVFTGTHAFNATFYGCTSLTEAPVIDFPATAANCCLQMFYGCTSLTEAPIIPSAALTTNCYNGMFQNCSKLLNLEVHFSSWNPTGATTNWLTGTGSGGTFKCYSELPATPRDNSHIPVSWSIEYLN